LVHFQEYRFNHVVPNELERWVGSKRLDIMPESRKEVVQTDHLVPFIEQRLAQETAYKTRSTRDQNTHQSVKLEGLRVRCKSTRSLKRGTSNGDLESPTSVLKTKGTRGDGAKIKLIHVTPGKFLGSTIVHHKNHLWSATDMLDLNVLLFDCEVAVQG
jgi:hypothetical protein